MPRIVKRLTDKQIDNAQPKEKDYRLYDGEGLALLVRKSGTKVWQYPYKYKNKNTIYTIGKYLGHNYEGHVGLQDARKVVYEIKSQLSEGKDPYLEKTKRQLLNDQQLSFESIARDWHSKGVWVEKHSKNILSSLEKDVFPIIGRHKVTDISARDIILVLSKVEGRGALDVAKRICQRCEAIFDYAISKGLCDNNPAIGRAKYIKSPDRENRPFLKEGQLPEFLNRLSGYTGRKYVRLGLKILLLTFVRPGELRNATWDEVDLNEAIWVIPARYSRIWDGGRFADRNESGFRCFDIGQ